MSDDEKKQAVVRRFFQAAGSGDFATAMGLIAPGCLWTYHAPVDLIPFGGRHEGPAGVARFFEITAGLLSIDAMEIDRMAAFDDHVIVAGRERCTVHRTGASYEAEWLHLVRTDGETILAYDEYVDGATIARAIGAL
ncbi:hypothetical protein HY78_02030 [Rhizorhabdus wittichii DC-6]|uniref:SnoaL-like domain-containing protein n=2 Tax=Rhizorhabdus wittichii TaxID=160791 RepID=A0A9J9HFZ2_RHIWR|nr:nuclear transport factor 2 family protein [Rhizorhabdus wittichii]ABQ70960.1 hypothetical protein Swit_4622 [Rhizorhabdus wittichii RW1]ARR52320.1 hypothetical protein HY78_02030 [Rhizorhabdus wittichii DC-6]QTH23555.1 nuclear transport factor 2 family protein [Rhizorhabdus wittichii]